MVEQKSSTRNEQRNKYASNNEQERLNNLYDQSAI